MVIQKIISAMVLFFSIQSLSAQEIDKSLYQKTTLNYLRHSSGTPKVIEYYKFDVVFVGRRPGAGIEFFGFIELNDQLDDAVSEFKGPNTLPEIKQGQFVTVYFREFPVSSSFALPEYLIDHIEIPAEVFSFTATHKIIEKTNVMFPPGDGVRLMIPVDSGVEVQVLGREFHISKIEDGKGNLLTGYWMWHVTDEGYGGWTFCLSLRIRLSRKQLFGVIQAEKLVQR